jgi:hypothetical protein
MDARELTAKQRAVATLRYDRKATIEEIAGWLHITERAVYYRLKNIRHRTAQWAGGSLVYPSIAASGRRYSASQISTAGGPTPTLSLDEV